MLAKCLVDRRLQPLKAHQEPGIRRQARLDLGELEALDRLPQLWCLDRTARPEQGKHVALGQLRIGKDTFDAVCGRRRTLADLDVAGETAQRVELAGGVEQDDLGRSEERRV